MNHTGTWTRKGSTIIVFDPVPPHATDDEFDAERFEFESESGGGQPVLRLGSRGSAVSDLQRRLQAHGFNPGPIDGIFGSGTDAAVRSFQRSQGLTADGIVGPATWARVGSGSGRGTPPPSPGPYPGPSPSPGPGPAPAPGSAGARIVAEALKHLGFQEGPNNQNPFSDYFGVPNVPWCAYFVSYVYTMSGIPLNIGSSSVLLDTLMNRHQFFTTTPAPGDIVIFDWTLGDHDEAEHVGIVEGAYRDASGQLRVKTIEGNTSNGVNRREYKFGYPNIVGYGRIAP